MIVLSVVSWHSHCFIQIIYSVKSLGLVLISYCLPFLSVVVLDGLVMSLSESFILDTHRSYCYSMFIL